VTFLARLLLILIVIGIVGAAGAFVVAKLPTTTCQIAQPAQIDGALVATGRYLAAAGDCAACHTAPGGKPFAGGLALATPIGTVYSTNITPDRETGIGGYSLNDFDRAVRRGVTPDGGTLYPAMPYPSYAKLSDPDVTALYAYFIRGAEPVKAANRPTEIRWPLSVRWPLALWRVAFAPAVTRETFDASRYSDSLIAPGAFLTQGLGHCGACHTRRAVTLQEEGLDDASPAYLAGEPLIDGWVAVNLRGDKADGLGSIGADEIVATLRAARSVGWAVIGSPMTDVVVHSTQSMTDDDLKAIAAYLKR
jgi:mono/diheme cytochrome c family protein